MQAINIKNIIQDSMSALVALIASGRHSSVNTRRDTKRCPRAFLPAGILFKEQEMTKWIEKICPGCRRKYQFPEGVNDPGVCMNFDCQHKLLHPELKRKGVIGPTEDKLKTGFQP